MLVLQELIQGKLFSLPLGESDHQIHVGSITLNTQQIIRCYLGDNYNYNLLVTVAGKLCY